MRTALAGLAAALGVVAVSCGDDVATTAGQGTRCDGRGAATGQRDITLAPGALGQGTLGGEYHRHVPKAYDGTMPVPLVLYLHGYGQGLDDADSVSGLPALGERRGFVTVVPQIAHGNTPHWDDTPGSADEAWLGSLVDDLTATLCVDTYRIYVTGLSNGAMMTSTLACAFADRIAAVAPIAGLRDPAGCTPSRPVPIIAVHGTDDASVAYDGGYGPALAGLVLPDAEGSLAGVLSPDGPSVPEMAAAWAARDGCSGPAPSEERLGEAVMALRFPCPAAGSVVVLRYEGFGHVWRVGQPLGGASPAVELIWSFFVEHPLRATS